MGDTDALIITPAGCTGLSLHASRRLQENGGDIRRRHLIELQAPSDIKNQIQAYGRVNRYDQVVPPKITAVDSGIPAETKWHILRNGKLESMSAVVNSDRSNPALIDEIPDIFNAVGDRVCYQYLEAHPEMAQRLNISLPEPDLDDPEKDVNTQYFAHKLMSRYIMMSPEEQERIYEDIQAEYVSVIQELDSINMNPLKAREIAGSFAIESKVVYEPETLTGRIPTSMDAAVDMVTLRGKRIVNPARSDEVARLIDQGYIEMAGNTPQMAGERMQRRADVFERGLRLHGYPSAQAAIEAGVTEVMHKVEERQQVIDTYLALEPGCEVTLTIDEEPHTGVLLRMQLPARGAESLTSHALLHYLIPGEENPRMISMATFLRDNNMEISRGIHGDDYEAVMEKFDRAPAGEVTFKRQVMAGNLFRAAALAIENKMGQVVTYKDDNGVAHRGVLVNRTFHGKADLLPLPLRSPILANAYFQNCDPLNMRSEENRTSKGVLFHAPANGQQRLLSLPSPRSRRWSHLYANPVIRELVGEKNSKVQSSGCGSPCHETRVNACGFSRLSIPRV